jgi:hypothetical protein
LTSRGNSRAILGNSAKAVALSIAKGRPCSDGEDARTSHHRNHSGPTTQASPSRCFLTLDRLSCRPLCRRLGAPLRRGASGLTEGSLQAGLEDRRNARSFRSTPLQRLPKGSAGLLPEGCSCSGSFLREAGVGRHHSSRPTAARIAEGRPWSLIQDDRTRRHRYRSMTTPHVRPGQ